MDILTMLTHKTWTWISSYLFVFMCIFSMWTSDNWWYSMITPNTWDRKKSGRFLYPFSSTHAWFCLHLAVFIETIHFMPPRQSSEIWIRASGVSVHVHVFHEDTQQPSHSHRQGIAFGNFSEKDRTIVSGSISCLTCISSVLPFAFLGSQERSHPTLDYLLHSPQRFWNFTLEAQLLCVSSDASLWQ